MKIKNINWKRGRFYDGTRVRNTALLPFNHSAMVIQCIEGDLFRWNIKRGTFDIAGGIEETEQKAMESCESAWQEIVKEALEEV